MFIFDTNVFITASRSYYGFDIAPGYWEWIRSEELKDVRSSVHAKAEIDAGDYSEEEDPLKAWASATRAGFWVKDRQTTLEAMQELAEWVAGPDRTYTDNAVSDFLDSVDFRIIAQAKAESAAVVTLEVSEPNRRNKVKIPDACAGIGVESVDPFTAYRRLGLRLEAA